MLLEYLQGVNSGFAQKSLSIPFILHSSSLLLFLPLLYLIASPNFLMLLTFLLHFFSYSSNHFLSLSV